jgi:hypothetical protein
VEMVARIQTLTAPVQKAMEIQTLMGSHTR